MALENPVTSWDNPQFIISHHTWKLFGFGFGYYFVSDTSPSTGLGKPSVETTTSCPWNSSSRLCKSVWSDLPLSSELELAINFNNHLLKTTWTEKTSDFETVRFLCRSTLSGFLTFTHLKIGIGKGCGGSLNSIISPEYFVHCHIFKSYLD